MYKKRIHLQLFRNITIIISIIFFIQFIVQVFTFDHIYVNFQLQKYKSSYQSFTNALETADNDTDLMNLINNFSLKTNTNTAILNNDSIIDKTKLMNLEITTTEGIIEIYTIPIDINNALNQPITIQGYQDTNSNDLIAFYINIDNQIVLGQSIDSTENQFNLIINHYDFSHITQIHGTLTSIHPVNSNINLTNNNILKELLQLPYVNKMKIRNYDNTSQYYISQNNIVFIHQTVHNNMQVISIIPLASYYSAYHFIILLNTIISFILLIITLILTYMNTKSVTKPLRQLNSHTINYAYLNQKIKLPLSTNNEIQSIADSFYNLSSTIEEYNRKIDQLNKKTYEFLKNESNNELVRQNLYENLGKQLKEPFENIHIVSQLLLENPNERINIKNIKYLYNETIQCAKIINDLIQINQIKENTLKKNYEPIDLRLLIENVLREIDHNIARYNIVLQLNIQINFVLGDKNKLALAIKYLFMTAFMYARENNYMHITLKEQNNKINFIIENASASLPKDMIDLIFQPRFIMDDIVNKDLDVSILSMYIVKLILEQHNADFGVNNTKQGITYYFNMNKYDINQLL